jgi:hypothetical protein
MENMFFQSFIEMDKWNAAGWKGTVFVHDPSGKREPMIGIQFENIESGKQIFAQWVRRLGKIDRFEELRISIVEGEILGEGPGYSVHISSDPGHTIKRAASEGKQISADLTAVVGRIHRMVPEPGSPHLPRFKREFQQHGKYFFIPVSSAGELLLDYAIGKTEIHLRQASEITANDVDSVVFPEHYFDGDHIKN